MQDVRVDVRVNLKVDPAGAVLRTLPRPSVPLPPGKYLSRRQGKLSRE